MSGAPVALVTGAAVRVGRAIVLRLAHEGFDVAIHCRRSRGEAEAAAREVAALGRRACVVPADLADLAAVADLVPQVSRALGPPTILVNSAAIFELDRLDSMTPESWERHMAVNLRAPAFLCQGFLRALPDDREGLIVNIIDERVLNLTPNYLSYSTAKYGLWGLTQVLARQLAPRVRVNAIGPGPALPVPGWPQERFDALVETMPLKRGTSPEEIAEAVVFLLRSRSITGHMLTLDGGQHMGWLVSGARNGT